MRLLSIRWNMTHVSQSLAVASRIVKPEAGYDKPQRVRRNTGKHKVPPSACCGMQAHHNAPRAAHLVKRPGEEGFSVLSGVNVVPLAVGLGLAQKAQEVLLKDIWLFQQRRVAAVRQHYLAVAATIGGIAF